MTKRVVWLGVLVVAGLLLTAAAFGVQEATEQAPAAEPESVTETVGTETVSPEPAPAKQTPTGGWTAIVMQLLPILLIFVVLYVLLIAPQRKKEKQRTKMLEGVRKNDKVVTIGGVYGVVKSVSQDEVVVQVDEGKDLRLRMARWGIREVREREGEGEVGKE